jgi:hypothetical protein
VAKLCSKTVGEITFACYGERGIVGYFMLRALPTDPIRFMSQIEDGEGEKPFARLQPESITGLTIFSELGFGSKYGFGNPDGAIYFKVDGRSRLFFYEAKLNETYRQSCRHKSYNSTIQGQLELKWRLLNLFHQGSFQTEKGKRYVVETQAFATFYASQDTFYSPNPKKRPASGLGAFRHLQFDDGVKTILDTYVKGCGPDEVFFLVSTNDGSNPLIDNTTTGLPRCFGKTWDEVKRQFCWISNRVIENCSSV